MGSAVEAAQAWIKRRGRPKVEELSITAVERDPERSFFTRVGEDVTEIYPLPQDVIVE